MDLEKFQALNPLVLCGVLPPQPGSPVCTGDTIAFCNNVYVASQTDTCNTIANTVGTILNIDGEGCVAMLSLSARTAAVAHVARALQRTFTGQGVLAPLRVTRPMIVLYIAHREQRHHMQRPRQQHRRPCLRGPRCQPGELRLRFVCIAVAEDFFGLT